MTLGGCIHNRGRSTETAAAQWFMIRQDGYGGASVRPIAGALLVLFNFMVLAWQAFCLGQTFELTYSAGMFLSCDLQVWDSGQLSEGFLLPAAVEGVLCLASALFLSTNGLARFAKVGSNIAIAISASAFIVAGCFAFFIAAIWVDDFRIPAHPGVDVLGKSLVIFSIVLPELLALGVFLWLRFSGRLIRRPIVRSLVVWGTYCASYLAFAGALAAAVAGRCGAS